MAFVSNEMGKYKIWLYDLKTKKQTKIISVGHKLDRLIDFTVPVIAWEPKGKKLAFISEKKGKIQMNYYDISKGKTTTFELQHLQKVLSMEYDKKGKEMQYDLDRMFALINKGNDFVMIQMYVFGKIMRDQKEFIKR